MAAMLKTTSTWTGFSGAPGYTNLYFEHQDPPSTTADNAALATRGLWVGLSTMLPNDVSIQVSSLVEEIDDAEGDLVGEVTATSALATVTGTDSGIWSGPSGVVLNWTTTSIHRARRVKGRTYAVPLGGVAYENNGTIGSTPLTSIRAAAAAFLAFPGCDPVIWCRPVYTDTEPRTLVAPGAHYPVTGYNVADRVAILRSRRD